MLPINNWHRAVVCCEWAALVFAQATAVGALIGRIDAALIALGGCLTAKAALPFFHRAGIRAERRFIRREHPCGFPMPGDRN